MTNQNNILTKEEIKWLIGSLNRNLSELEITKVMDYVQYNRPYVWKHLEDKEFKKSYIRLIYLQQNALVSYVKADKEVKDLQCLTTSLEQEKNELLEKNKQLEVKLEEKDNRIEELEERVDIEVEMNLKALDKSAEWREKQLKEVKSAHILREKWFLKRIEVLENNISWLKNKEQIIKKYENKELPALPKQQKENRLHRLKKLVSRVKEKTQEKFQTFIVQKNK